jgi:3-dehydroquinate synthase
VGVKNGVNAFGVKNLLGSFAPPFAVLNDAKFLRTPASTRPDRGIAEAVKVSLIRDGVFFEWLESQVEALRAFTPEATARMIRRCAELHMRQIAHGGDPFEMAVRGRSITAIGRPISSRRLPLHELRHGEAGSDRSGARIAATRCRLACWLPGRKSASCAC